MTEVTPVVPSYLRELSRRAMISELEGEDVLLLAQGPAIHYITFRKPEACCASCNKMHVGGSLAAAGGAIVAAVGEKWFNDDAALRPCP